jgi:hypothetical protein
MFFPQYILHTYSLIHLHVGMCDFWGCKKYKKVFSFFLISFLFHFQCLIFWRTSEWKSVLDENPLPGLWPAARGA